MRSDRRFSLCAAALALAVAASSAAGNPQALVGATVHPIAGPAIEDGAVVFQDGVIRAIGARDDVVITGATEVIEVEGLHLWPGLVDAATYLGLTEIGSVRGTVDVTESGPMNPNARAAVAVNASSSHFPVTRANGTLLAASLPRGSLVPGHGAALALDGWTWEEMVRADPLGLVISWPSMARERPGRGRGRGQRGDDEGEGPKWEERVARLDDMVREGRAYLAARGDGAQKRDADVRWESLAAVLEGRVPVWVAAGSLAQIRAALDWTEKHGLNMVLLDGGRSGGDAWRVAQELASRDVPVVTRTNRVPRRRYEPYDTPFTAPAKLYERGVRIAFGSFNAAHARALPQEAARAVTFGLPRDAACRALTLGAAEVLGIAERYGSLEVGKSATFILVDGDLLDTRMQVERAWLDGQPVDLESKHVRLWKRWRARPQARGEGG